MTDAGELWEKHGWLVKHWTNTWASRAGEHRWDECWHVCMNGFLRAVETWRPDGGAAFNTWLTTALSTRLRDWSKREARKAANLPPPPPPPEDPQTFRTAVAELGDGAAAVVRLVLDLPGAFDGLRRPAEELRAVLLEAGWTERDVRRAFDEVKEMLRSL